MDLRLVQVGHGFGYHRWQINHLDDMSLGTPAEVVTPYTDSSQVVVHKVIMLALGFSVDLTTYPPFRIFYPLPTRFPVKFVQSLRLLGTEARLVEHARCTCLRVRGRGTFESNLKASDASRMCFGGDRPGRDSPCPIGSRREPGSAFAYCLRISSGSGKLRFRGRLPVHKLKDVYSVQSVIVKKLHV